MAHIERENMGQQESDNSNNGKPQQALAVVAPQSSGIGSSRMADTQLDRLAFEPQNWEQAFRVAEVLSKSGILPKGVDTPQKAIAIIMRGREIGLTSMQALTTIYVVEGRTQMSADLMVGLILTSGKCEYFDPVVISSEVVTYVTKRRGSSREVEMSWTIADAERAGLLTKDVWKKYPMSMLTARCKSALGHAVYPELVAGIYTPEEGEHTVIDVGAAQSEDPPAPPPRPSEKRRELIAEFERAVRTHGLDTVEDIIGKPRGSIISAEHYMEANEKIAQFEKGFGGGDPPAEPKVAPPKKEEPPMEPAPDSGQVAKPEPNQNAAKTTDGNEPRSTTNAPNGTERARSHFDGQKVEMRELYAAAKAANVELAKVSKKRFGRFPDATTDDEKRDLLAILRDDSALESLMVGGSAQ